MLGYPNVMALKSNHRLYQYPLKVQPFKTKRLDINPSLPDFENQFKDSFEIVEKP